MIQIIRKHFGKKATRTLLIILALSMAGITSFTGIFRRFSGISAQDIATVNNQPISRLAFKSKLEEIDRRINYIKSQFGENAAYFLTMLRLNENPQDLALEELLQAKLLEECAQKIPLRLSNEYIMRKLDDPQFVVQNLSEYVIPPVFDALGGINQKVLIEYLRSKGLSLKDFEEAVENTLKRLVVISLATGSLYIPHFAVKERFLQEYVAKDFTVIHLPLASFIKKAQETVPSEETLKQFFEQQNRAQRGYWNPEERSATVWKFKAEDYGIVITDKEIEDYFRKNREKFISKSEEIEVRKIVLKVTDKKQEHEKQALAEKIYQELKNQPTQFAEMAHRYSEDKKSASKGGLIGFISNTSDLEPALRQAVFSLESDGDISLPVRTQEGFEIVGRVSKKPAVYKENKAAAPEIKEILTQEKFKRLFAQDARRMIIDHAEFNAWLEKKKTTKKELKNKQLEQNLLSRKMFEMSSGKKIFFLDGDEGVIMELTDSKSAHPQEYEAVKKKVAEDYYKNQALNLIQNSLKELENKDPQTLEKTAQGEIVHLKNITKESDMQKWTQKGLPPYFFKATVPGSIRVTLTPEGGYVAILTTIQNFNEEQFEDHKQEIETQLLQEQMPLLMSSFIASLEKHATIKVNFQGLKKS